MHFSCFWTDENSPGAEKRLIYDRPVSDMSRGRGEKSYAERLAEAKRAKLEADTEAKRQREQEEQEAVKREKLRKALERQRASERRAEQEAEIRRQREAAEALQKEAEALKGEVETIFVDPAQLKAVADFIRNNPVYTEKPEALRERFWKAVWPDKSLDERGLMLYTMALQLFLNDEFLARDSAKKKGYPFAPAEKGINPMTVMDGNFGPYLLSAVSLYIKHNVDIKGVENKDTLDIIYLPKKTDKKTQKSYEAAIGYLRDDVFAPPAAAGAAVAPGAAAPGVTAGQSPSGTAGQPGEAAPPAPSGASGVVEDPATLERNRLLQESYGKYFEKYFTAVIKPYELRGVDVYDPLVFNPEAPGFREAFSKVLLYFLEHQSEFTAETMPTWTGFFEMAGLTDHEIELLFPSELEEQAREQEALQARYEREQAAREQKEQAKKQAETVSQPDVPALGFHLEQVELAEVASHVSAEYKWFRGTLNGFMSRGISDVNGLVKSDDKLGSFEKMSLGESKRMGLVPPSVFDAYKGFKDELKVFETAKRAVLKSRETPGLSKIEADEALAAAAKALTVEVKRVTDALNAAEKKAAGVTAEWLSGHSLPFVETEMRNEYEGENRIRMRYPKWLRPLYVEGKATEAERYISAVYAVFRDPKQGKVFADFRELYAACDTKKLIALQESYKNDPRTKGFLEQAGWFTSPEEANVENAEKILNFFNNAIVERNFRHYNMARKNWFLTFPE